MEKTGHDGAGLDKDGVIDSERRCSAGRSLQDKYQIPVDIEKKRCFA